MIAQGVTLVFLLKFDCDHLQQGCQIQVWWVKVGYILPVFCHISETMQNGDIVKTNNDSYALCQMVLSPLTLSDLSVPQTTPVCTFWIASRVFLTGGVRDFKFWK